jgi:putative addiction module component (TIGR02574 family)
MTTAELLPELLKLSPDDQRLIAEALWQHLGEIQPIDEMEFKRELDRRLEDIEKNPQDEISWDDLSRELDRL